MRRIVVTALLVGFAASTAGCGGGAAHGQTRSATPSAAARTQASVPPSGLVLTANRADYLNYLRRVDRRLVVNEDRAVRGAESTCKDIEAGLAGRSLLQRVGARFSAGHVKVGKVKAVRIVAAARRWIC